jgi:AAA ATPase domain
MAEEWPLVGRRDELAAIAAARAQGLAGVALVGTAGSGRSRLLAEAVAAATRDGCAAVTVAVTRELAASPVGALAERMLPPGEARRAGDLDGLARRLVRALAERAGGRRLVLAVDDADLLDERSAALLERACSQPPGGGAFALLTVTIGAPMQPPLASLRAQRRLGAVEVRRLARNELEALAAAALGAVDPLTLGLLWRLTLGSPRDLATLLAAGRERGALTEDGGLWRWRGPVVLPPALADPVRAELARLPDDERAALVLTALGEPLGADLLERLVGAVPAESLRRRGLLAIERSDQRADAHLARPILGEVLRAEVPPDERRTALGFLAGVLDATGARRQGDEARAVGWRLEAGQPVPPERLLAAARQAIGADAPQAERLARAAVDAGAGTVAELIEARAIARQGRAGDAEVRWAHLAGRLRGDAEVLEVALDWAAARYWALGQSAEAEAVLRDAEAAVAGQEAHDELVAARAVLLAYDGRCAEAEQLAAPLLDGAADGVPDDAAAGAGGPGRRAQARALHATTAALALAGRGDDALAAARRAFRLVPALDDHAVEVAAQLELLACHAELWAGRLAEAEGLARRCQRRVLDAGAVDAVAAWSALLARVALAQGRATTGVALAREAEARLRARDPYRLLPGVLGDLAYGLAVSGETSPATAALTEAERLTSRAGQLHALSADLARPWVVVAREGTAAAVELALEQADRARRRGQHAVEAQALHAVVRLGAPQWVSRRLDRLAGTVQGPLAGVLAAHGRALATADGGLLDQVAAAFDRLGARLLAAEAAAQAVWAHRRAGDTTAAAASATRSKAASGGCEGARTPALRLLGTRPGRSLRARLTRARPRGR